MGDVSKPINLNFNLILDAAVCSHKADDGKYVIVPVSTIDHRVDETELNRIK